jgi:hypothetical protein
VVGFSSQELLCAGAVVLKELLGTTFGCAQTSRKGNSTDNDV